MSQHHHHRHNSSLSRAIRAQTGVAAYPYMEYAPVNYDAQYNYGAPYGGAYGAYGRSPVNPPGAGDTITTTGTFGPSQEVKDWIYGDNGGGNGSDEEEDTGEETSPDEEEGEGDGSESKSARRRRGRRRRMKAKRRRSAGRRIKYGGYGEVDPVSAAITGLASLIGVGVKTGVTAAQAKRLQAAELAAQEQRLRLELDSNERSLAAQYAASANAAVGGHGKTILISLSVLGLLGGGLYFVLRKKKK